MPIQDFGIIKACKGHSPKCRYKCCVFKDNYIVLYPNEFEKSRLNKTHLRIIDGNHFGGKKAICLRLCTKDDFKPLDCKGYPYFPRIDKDGKIRVMKSNRCPLTKNELVNHKREFLEIWKDLVKDRAIFEWVKNLEKVVEGLGHKPER